MADKKSITTALDSIFGKSKPNELDARVNINKTLQTAYRDIATRPELDPTLFSDKGLRHGALFADDRNAGSLYFRYLEREGNRALRYSQYERMDADLVASALDVYANEATQKNANKRIIEVSSNSKFIEQELSDLFDRLGINGNRAWNMVRSMCKYGDHFIGLQLDSRFGVVGLKDFDTNTMYRVEHMGKLSGYIQDLSLMKNAARTATGTASVMNPYIGLMRMTMPAKDFNDPDAEKKGDVVKFKPYEVLHLKLTGRSVYDPYGTSLLDPAVEMWKKLDLLSDSVIIYRINKAPSRYVFYVDVGSNQGGDIESFMMKQINKVNKKEYYDPSGKINERYQLLDMNANLYIPVKSNASNSKVDLLQGQSNIGEIEDIKYITDRLFSALKVPKSFLGFEGDTSGKGMLSQQNVTFSKAIQNLQEDFLHSLKDLCLIHLAIKGITDKKSIESFKLTMTQPSYIEESARISTESERINLATSYQGLGVDLKWIIKNILGKSDADIRDMFPNGMPQPQSSLDAGLGGLGGLPGGNLGTDLGGLGGSDLGGLGGEAPIPTGTPIATPGMEQQPLLQHNIERIGDMLVETSGSVSVTYNQMSPLDVMQLANNYRGLTEHFVSLLSDKDAGSDIVDLTEAVKQD